MIHLTRRAGMAVAAVALAAAQARDEPFLETVGEWEIEEATGMDGERSPMMQRRAGGARFILHAMPGSARSVALYREGCDDVFEKLGTQPEEMIWLTGGPAENLATVRATARMLAARMTPHCDAPAGEIDTALSDLDAAFARFEARLKDKPFPDAAAWTQGGSGWMSFGRIEGRLAIGYDLPTPYNDARLTIRCGDDEDAAVETAVADSGGKAGDVAAAKAALAAGLKQAEARCGLARDVAPRMLRGFEDALALEWDNNKALNDAAAEGGIDDTNSTSAM